MHGQTHTADKNMLRIGMGSETCSALGPSTCLTDAFTLSAVSVGRRRIGNVEVESCLPHSVTPPADAKAAKLELLLKSANNIVHEANNLRFNHPRPRKNCNQLSSTNGILLKRAAGSESNSRAASTLACVSREELRQRLIGYLRQELQSSQDYAVEPFRKKSMLGESELDYLTRRESAKLSVQMASQPPLIDILNLSSDEEIVELCIHSKEQSIAFQRSITTLDTNQLERVIKIVSSNLLKLCTDKLGNYVVQQLVRGSPELKNQFANLCLNRREFMKFAANEYSSRVMQVCVEICPLFRREVLKLVKQDFSRVVASSAPTFLLTVCFRYAQSESDILFPLVYLSKDKNHWLGTKFFKRILVSLATISSSTVLDRIYSCIEHLLTTQQLFSDKYSVFLALTLIQRGHLPTIYTVCKNISMNIALLLKMKHFKFFLASIVGNKVSSVAEVICSAVSRVSKNLDQDRYLNLFKIYAIVSTASTLQYSDVYPRVITLLANSMHVTKNSGNPTFHFN